MKKILTCLGLIVTFFIIYFFQTNFFSWFNIAGVKPNLFIILILFIGLFINNKLGAVFGFFMGMYLDILTGSYVGISAVLYTFMGFLCGYLDRRVSKEGKITILLIVAGSTFVYEIISYIYFLISMQVAPQILGFTKILLIEVIFNCLLTIILHPTIKRMGNFLKNIYNKPSVRTGYILSK